MSTLTITFALSGLGIMVLVLAKHVQEKYRSAFFFLRIISRGDSAVRELNHSAAHFYSVAKERGVLIVTKQLPMRAKSHWNKFSTVSAELGREYIKKIRDARLLRKQKDDGISEFFKSINDIEKGAGEIIEEPYGNSFQEAEETR